MDSASVVCVVIVREHNEKRGGVPARELVRPHNAHGFDCALHASISYKPSYAREEKV